MFRSLRIYNYRSWAIGAVVSNIGTWLQRTAQDWLVLTQLTHQNATSVGIVTTLQFAPQVALLPFTGLAADRMDRRRLLFITQACMGLLALGLGALTLAGVVTLWEVYVFAFLLGCVTAFDSPARHTFVAELVPEADLTNAVALNSTSFNAARLVGPAIGGGLIAAVGCGWAFVLNGISFTAVLISLVVMHTQELSLGRHAARRVGQFTEGLRYVLSRADLRTVFLMLLLVGVLGLNLTVFISTMAVMVFHQGPGKFGFLTSAMAVGSVTGSLLVAREERPRVSRMLLGALFLCVGLSAASLMPNDLLFAAALVLVGVSAQTLTTTANSAAQLTTEPAMRGRVLALLLAIVLGGVAVGGPIAGWVADTFNPRWSLRVGAVSGFAAAMVGLTYLARHADLRFHREGWRFSWSLDDPGLSPAPPTA